jgi:hypothetical protein
MSLYFPPDPSLNQLNSIGQKSWTWNGYAWDLVSTSGGGGGGGGGTASGLAFTTVSTTQSLTTSQSNILLDTTNGSINISLPTGIANGYTILVGDGGGNKDVSPAYIFANTSTINGVSGALNFNMPNMLFYMIYTGSTWKVLING